jgi:hypothetical protein
MLYHFTYRGVRTYVGENEGIGIFFGEIRRPGGWYSFQGDSLASVEAAFHDVVDEFMSEPDAMALFRDHVGSVIQSPPLPSEPGIEVFDRGTQVG